WSISDVTMLRNMALRAELSIFSLRPDLRCRIATSSCQAPARLPHLVLGEVVELHAEREVELPEDLLDLVQGLPPEVLGLEHLGLGLLDQLPDVLDAGVLQAVL